MNKYLCYVTGPEDSLGISFIKNVVKLAAKGATLVEDKLPRCSFPQSCWMYIETDDALLSTPGFTYQLISAPKNKEELDAMEWDEFRALLRKSGIVGRNRDHMTAEYLEHTGQPSCELKGLKP